MITTVRLRIFVPSPDDVRAFRDGGRDALAARLRVAVPAGWPVFPETVEAPGQWWGIHTADTTLAVEGGISPPDAEGTAVFGYAVVAGYRERGLGTEFAGALVEHARESGRVRALDAYTFPAGAVSPEGFPADPSIGVLTRLGFVLVDRGEHWHWRKDLAAEVALRPIEDADLDALFELMRDPESVRMAAFTAKDPDDRQAFDAHMARIRARTDVTNRVITYGGRLVGSIACFVLDGDTEITYWVDRSVWGQGIASRALAALLDLVPVRPVHARAASDNIGSLRVLQKAGFRIVGTDVGYANARGTEIEETLLRLD